ncbi:MAG: SDR family oxidoreductase [Holophagaceae bacterium]|nr:SDR family oxidoreductase [Holophagaceae bacterium]
MNLRDAKILITGGSSGIGFETARTLIEAGAQVAITGRDEAKLQAAAEKLKAHGIRADVSDAADVQRMVDETVRVFGSMNVLINNAGIGSFAPLVALDLAEFRRVMDTNVFGAMLAGQAAARQFIAQGKGGSLINIASTAAQRGFANGTAYTASKFALAAMTECWRAELRTHGIRVMQLNPSEVVTEFQARMGHQQVVNETKLRAREIAHAIKAMLEMDDRGFVTELTVWATNPK